MRVVNTQCTYVYIMCSTTVIWYDINTLQLSHEFMILGMPLALPYVVHGDNWQT